MQITHEEAHRLIQFNTDDALKMKEKMVLLEHMQACAECRAYAQSLTEIESILRPLLQKNWNKQPLPLSMTSILRRRNQGVAEGALLATRMVVIGIICMGFLFSVWQFTVTAQATPAVSAFSVPPMPTPSTQNISITSTSNHCAVQPYVVQNNDTVESIAQRFSVSKNELLIANNLSSESPSLLTTGRQILIPTCTSTPTGTLNASTITYTPSRQVITSTPGG